MVANKGLIIGGLVLVLVVVGYTFFGSGAETGGKFYGGVTPIIVQQLSPCEVQCYSMYQQYSPEREFCARTLCSMEFDDDGFLGFTNDQVVEWKANAPPGLDYVVDDVNVDCDAYNAEINPRAREVCDGVDNNCNAYIDEADAGTIPTPLYADLDSDGYGNSSSSMQFDTVNGLLCPDTSGYVSSSNDCDDSEAMANPGETEVCDYIDNDCDGSVDEGGWWQTNPLFVDLGICP